MKLVAVKSPREAQEFLHLPVRLYKDCAQWIRPLDVDIEHVFDPSHNPTFHHGACERWILIDRNNQTIGRVAAFVNEKTVSQGNDQPTGGMGFFECIDDKDAAFALFDQCKTWLKERGMEAMDGPVNFGSRDRWWGLLVEGFELEPNYQCAYHFPYYQKLFEAYGFQVYFKQFTFGRRVSDPLLPRVMRKADMVMQNPDYQFRYLGKEEMSRLPEYILQVYNKAWTNRSENPEITYEQASVMVKSMKPILDRTLLVFGFYKEEPVAFFLSLPEINQIVKRVNGRMDTWGKIKFLWHKVRGKNKKALGLLFGVVPEHQGAGVDGAIISAGWNALMKFKRYEDFEMNWIGDFNPKMILVAKQIGGTVAKTHITYRKLFDESKPFRRAPILK